MFLPGSWNLKLLGCLEISENMRFPNAELEKSIWRKPQTFTCKNVDVWWCNWMQLDSTISKSNNRRVASAVIICRDESGEPNQHMPTRGWPATKINKIQQTRRKQIENRYFGNSHGQPIRPTTIMIVPYLPKPVCKDSSLRTNWRLCGKSPTIWLAWHGQVAKTWNQHGDNWCKWCKIVLTQFIHRGGIDFDNDLSWSIMIYHNLGATPELIASVYLIRVDITIKIYKVVLMTLIRGDVESIRTFARSGSSEFTAHHT